MQEQTALSITLFTHKVLKHEIEVHLCVTLTRVLLHQHVILVLSVCAWSVADYNIIFDL